MLQILVFFFINLVKYENVVTLQNFWNDLQFGMEGVQHTGDYTLQNVNNKTLFIKIQLVCVEQLNTRNHRLAQSYKRQEVSLG